jgi:hypothetical protein
MGPASLAFVLALTQQAATGIQPGPWALLAPAPCETAPATADDPFGIEKRLRKMEAGQAWEELRQDYDGGGKPRRKLRWIQCTDELNLAPAGSPGLLDTPVFDFNALFGLGNGAPENVKVAAYLYRGITAASAKDVEMSCGSDDALRIWLNGELLLDKAVARGLNVNDERLTLRLQPGVNHLLVKVVNVGGAWSFQMKEVKRVEQASINAAIDRGEQWLLDQQLIDGSWAEVQGEYRNGQTALSLYTLLKSGVAAQHPGVLQALAYLQSSPAEKTYTAGCQLMAAAAMKDPQHLWWAEETAGDLLSWQERNGGWSYPGVHTDMSLTQYAALGLRAAASLGIEIDPDVWNEMAEFALNHQQSWKSTDRAPAGGFSYHPGSGITGSMSTAGVAILYICREQLGDKIKPTIRRQVDESILAGGRWIDNQFTVRENPGAGASWQHYYLYGLERVGAFLNTERFGGREWYWEGAQFLVSAQGGAGEWGDPWGNWERNTCFALLFLNRATARATTQPAAEDPGKSRLVSSDAKDPVRLKLVRQTPAVVWVETKDTGIARVEYFIRSEGGDWELATVGEDRRFAGRFSLPRPGAWEAKAEAIKADGTRLSSSIVRFVHEEGIEGERLAYASDARRNRLPLQQPQVTCSTAEGGFVAPNVADNRFDTRWVCARNDKDPWVDVKLRRSVKTIELRLTHSRTTRKEAELQGYNPRPTRIEVIFNKDEDPIVYEMDPDARTKTVIRFPEPRKISQIRIRILEITSGTLGVDAAVGFTEIELHEAR